MIDPLSGGLALGGLVAQIFQNSKANEIAKQNLELQRQSMAQAKGISDRNFNFATDTSGKLTDFATSNSDQLLNALLSAAMEQKGLAGQGKADYENYVRGDVGRQNAFVEGDTAKQRAMAGGARRGAYGDVTKFDDTLNQWVTQLSPQQQAMIDQSLGDYNEARAGYKYKQPPSEESIRADITRLLTNAQRTGDMAVNELAQRQSLRQGGNMPIITSTNSVRSTTGQQLAETMLKAKQAALAESSTRQSQHASRYMPEMTFFGNQTRQPLLRTGEGSDQQNAMASLASTIYGNTGKQMADTYARGGERIGSAISGGNDALINAIMRGADLTKTGLTNRGNEVEGALTKGAGLVTGGYGTQLEALLSGLKGVGAGSAALSKTESGLIPDLAKTSTLYKNIQEPDLKQQQIDILQAKADRDQMDWLRKQLEA